MATLFGQMAPREITAIKMKMPITKNYDHFHQQMQALQENPPHRAAHNRPQEITIADIRAIFQPR